jgi:hypothetical protein
MPTAVQPGGPADQPPTIGAGLCDRHDLEGTALGTPTGAVGVHRHRNRLGDGAHDLWCEPVSCLILVHAIDGLTSPHDDVYPPENVRDELWHVGFAA